MCVHFLVECITCIQLDQYMLYRVLHFKGCGGREPFFISVASSWVARGFSDVRAELGRPRANFHEFT